MALFDGTRPTIIALTGKLWCGHCKDMEKYLVPELKRQKTYAFQQFDDSDPILSGKTYNTLATFQAVNSFPTLLIFFPKTKTFVRYTGSRVAPTKQQAEMRMKELNTFINQYEKTMLYPNVFPAPLEYKVK